MSRIVDALSVLLLAAAGGSFTFGIVALGEQQDLHALYWLAVGGLVLKGAVDLLRPGRIG